MPEFWKANPYENDVPLGQRSGRVPSPSQSDYAIQVSIPNWDDASDVRGLMLSHPMEVTNGGRGLKFTSGFRPEDLRSYLLFWDRLDVPQNNVMRIRHPPEMEFLEAAGVLKSTELRFEGKTIGGAWILDAQKAALSKLETHSPGVWSVARGPDSISFPERDLAAGRGLMFKLVDALPVPAGDVPLQDVLEFRHRRRAELLALRAHLEGVYRSIVDSGDFNLASMVEFERLDRAIADQIAISREAKFGFRISSLEANFSVGALLEGIGASAVATQLGLNHTQAALAGVGAAARKVFGDIGISVSLNGRDKSATPFQYVTSYHDELVYFK